MTDIKTDLVIRSAQAKDRALITELLETFSLPTAGVAEWLDRFVVAELSGELVGVAGLEVHGSNGVLRSVAVQHSLHGHGIGEMLIQSAIQAAKNMNLSRLYLLTNTAEQYFRRHGFRRISREEVAGKVQGSVEFQEACPASAVAMVLEIGTETRKSAVPQTSKPSEREAWNEEEHTLDPVDWEDFRRTAHAAIDTMVSFLEDTRRRPVWQKLPEDVRARLAEPVPETGEPLNSVLEVFWRDVLPYGTGNLHPRFWSWVAGNGSAVGMLADMLASGMNSPTLGIDDSAASEVEIQVIKWFKDLLGFPAESSGLMVSGGSMANMVGLAVARTAQAGYDVRKEGVNAPDQPRLVVYASTETHSCVQKATELLGIGSSFVRFIPTDSEFQIDIEALSAAINDDRLRGLKPVIVVGNAGTVNTGAIDPLDRLADLCEEHGLWFHIDGAFGAIAALAESPPRNLAGMARADSLAFDLHKWLHQPYNVGAVLIRHARLHHDTFHIAPAYLDRFEGGITSGRLFFGALGVQLSRSFVALRPWLSFKTHGVGLFRNLVDQNINQARYLDRLVRESKDLELLAETSLNIVNFRYNPGKLDEPALDTLNKKILVELQERGIAAPSSTRLGGRFSIRVCVTNHRSRMPDFDLLVEKVIEIGQTVHTRTGVNAPVR